MTPNEGQQLNIESRDRELPDDHWNRVYTDPAYFGEFSKRPAIQTGAELSPFPETYAKRQANIAYMSSTLGIPIEEMPAVYEGKKNELAKAQLGTPTLSDEGLFNYFKKQFDRDNEVNAAANTIYQDVQRSVFESLFKGETANDINNQPTYRPILEQKLNEAGDLLSDQDRLNIRENADKMADNLRRASDVVADEARWLFELVSKQTGRGKEYETAGEQPNPATTVGGLGPVMNLAVKQPQPAPEGKVDLNDPEMLNFQTEQVLEKFADMPRERRQAIYSLAGAFAELNQVDKGVFYQAAETLGRFLTREMGERISRNVTEEMIRGQQRLLDSDIPLYEATNLDGSKGLSQVPTAGQTPLNAEQRAKLKEDAARKLKILQVKRELVNLADTQIDPIKVVTDWPTWEQGFYGFVGSIPYAGIAAIPGIGFPAITASFFGQFKDDLLLEYPDMDPDQAATLSALAAPMAAGLELIQANLLMGKFVSLDRVIKFFLKPSRNPMTRIMARGTASFVAETGVELTQNRVLPIVQSIGAALDEDIPGYDWAKSWEGFDEELGVTAVTMLLFTLTGLPFITSQEINRNADYLKDKKMLRYFGASEEQAERVATSLTKEERVKNWKDVSANLDPKLVEAGRRQFIVDTKSELTEPEDPYMPVMRRDGDRYTVLDAEGNVVADRVDADTAFYEYERIAGSDQVLFASVQHELIKTLLDAGKATNAEGFTERIDVATQEVVNRYNNMTPEQLQRRIAQWERETGQTWQPGAAVNITAVNTLEQVKEGLFQSITRVVKATTPEEIRAVLEDRAEGQYKMALQAGQFTEADMVGWIREYEAGTGDSLLEEDFTSRDVVEAVSTMAVAYYTGNLDNSRVSSRLRAFFEALKEYFTAIFARGVRIKEAIAAGQISPEFEAFLAQSVGLDLDRQIGVQAAQQARADINGRTEPPRAMPLESMPQTVLGDGSVLVGPGTFAIKALHGSASKFDKFDMNFVGSGEGAAVYGHGLYMAENKDVATSYADKLSRKFAPSEEQLREYFKPGNIVDSYSGKDEVVAFDWNDGNWNVTVRSVTDPFDKGLRNHSTLPRQKSLIDANIDGATGFLYEVSIDANSDEFLNWDLPLSQQPQSIQDAFQFSQDASLASIVDVFGQRQQLGKQTNASEAYRLLGGAEAASKYLLSKGVKGIRYLDQGSRRVDPPIVRQSERSDRWIVSWTDAFGVMNNRSFDDQESAREFTKTIPDQQTYNYVIFDDGLVEILTRNGQPVQQESMRTFSINTVHSALKVPDAGVNTSATRKLPEFPNSTPSNQIDAKLADLDAIFDAIGSPLKNTSMWATFVRVLGKSMFRKARVETANVQKIIDGQATPQEFGLTDDDMPALREAMAELPEGKKPPKWITYRQAANEGEMIMPPGRAMDYAKGKGLDFILDDLIKHPEFIEARESGLSLGTEMLRKFRSGELGRRDLISLFIWGVLSRGVGAYPQEGGFLALHKDGLLDKIDAVLDGSLSVESFGEWAEGAVAGTPGASSTHNAMAVAEQLKALTFQIDGRMAIDILLDAWRSNMTGPQLRREIYRLFTNDRPAVQIQNKVISFIILVSGRPDVLVLDRVQFRHLWGGKQLTKALADLSKQIKQAKKATVAKYGKGTDEAEQALAVDENPTNMYDSLPVIDEDGTFKFGIVKGTRQIVSNGIFQMGNELHGMAIYEALESALTEPVRQAYTSRGISYPGLGAFHWDSWLVSSQQAIKHPTLALIAKVDESPSMGVTEGKFDKFAYGMVFRYDGLYMRELLTRPGVYVILTQDQVGQFTLEKLRKAVGRKFAVETNEDGSKRTRPWVDDLTSDERTKFDAYLTKIGQRTAPLGDIVADGRTDERGGVGSRLRSVAAVLAGRGGKLYYRPRSGQDAGGSDQTAGRGDLAPLTAQEFSRIGGANKASHKFGTSVDVYKAEDYNGYDLIVVELNGETATISISPNGEVGAVTKSAGAPSTLVDDAFAAAKATGNVKWLNGFDTILPSLYSSLGFAPVARVKFADEFAPEGWDYKAYGKYNGGRPDVVFMRYTGTPVKYRSGDAPYLNSYDEAVEAATRLQVPPTYAISPANYYGDLQAAVAALDSNPAFRRERVAAVLSKFKRIKEQFANKDGLEPLSMPEAVAQLEAIITLLPPDAQSEVGGFRRLLSFSTAKGRLNYLTDRIKKADAALEKYLRTELQEDILSMLERAAPKRGENKVFTSSLGPEAQRVANMATAAINLTGDEVSDRMAEIEAALTAAALTPEKQEQLLEEWGVLNMMGDFLNRSAMELDQARAWLRQTFGAGRAMWRMQEEARRRQYRDMAEELAGGLKKATENQIDKMDKENPWLKNPRQFILSHYSFMQLLRSVLPKTTFIDGWEKSIRQAEVESSRYRMDAAKRFIDVLMAASGKKTSFGVGRVMYDMRKTRKNVVRYKEGYNEVPKRLTLETALNILEGRASWKAFGLKPRDVDRLREAYLAVPIMRRRTTPDGKLVETVNRQQFVEFYVLENEGTDDKLTMSPAEAMQLLLSWDQADVQARMRRQGWTDESVQDMQKLVLSVPGGMAVMQFLRREYKEGGDKADPVYMRMFGMAMPRIENYAPTRYRHRDDSNDLSPMGSTLELAGTTPGSLKARQRHDARMRRTDAITVFFQHVAQMGHWIHFAEINREIRGVLKNQNVRESMEATLGRSGLQIFDQWMDTLAQGGGRRAMELSADRDIWAALISGKSIASLGFSVRTLFMQIDSATRAALDMGMGDFAKAVMDPRWISDMPTAWKSDTVQRRLIEGSRPEVRYVFERAAVKPSMLLWAAQKSMVPMQLTDAALTSFTAALVYRNAYNKAKKAGASDALAADDALNAMDKAVFNYSQPIDITSRSLREVQGNMLQKVYMMFLSDARLKSALFAESLANLGKEGKRAEGAKNITVLLAMAALSQTLGNLFRDWFDDEPDDEIWTLEGYAMAMMLAPFAGLMLVGTVADTVVSEAFGEFTFQQTNPASETISRGIRAVKGWDKTFDTSDPEAMLKQWNNLLRFVSFNPTLAAPAALLNLIKPIEGAMRNASNPE